MADRPTHHRGGRGGGHRGGGRGGRGGGGERGGGHHHAGGGAGADRERPKKENILDLGKYMDKPITVKFNGGREGELDPNTSMSIYPQHRERLGVKGTLKGYDALMNLVLDDVEESVRDDEGNESTRSLGLVVARGTLLVQVSPVDGSEVIANPFVAADDD